MFLKAPSLSDCCGVEVHDGCPVLVDHLIVILKVLNAVVMDSVVDVPNQIKERIVGIFIEIFFPGRTDPVHLLVHGLNLQKSFRESWLVCTFHR
jgi:hypothetical protein